MTKMLTVVLPLATIVSGQAYAAEIINADFEAFALGSPPPVGAASDRPSHIDANLNATVENATSISPATAVNSSSFVRLEGDPGEAPDLAFDTGVSPSSGLARISVDLLFESLDQYHVYYRQGSGAPGGSSTGGGNVMFWDDGNVYVEDEGGQQLIGTYNVNETINLTSVFDLDANTWDVYVDGVLKASGLDTIDDSPLGKVVIGFAHTASMGSFMQCDNLVVRTVPEPSTLVLLGAAIPAMVFGRRRRKACSWLTTSCHSDARPQ